MYTNNMTNLLNKIERRLGTRQMHLPEFLEKQHWAEIIETDTIVTFSRYIPNKIEYIVDPFKCKVPGTDWYLLDEKVFTSDVKILGVRDIKWGDFTNSTAMGVCCNGFGLYDWYANPFDLTELALTQVNADMLSLFNNGIFVDFEPPNRIKLTDSANQNAVGRTTPFKIEVLIEHSPNLTTIAPTKMEIFEELAMCDIAGWLYGELKYFDQLDTVLSTIDLKMDELREYRDRRENVMDKIRESYVSAGNDNQPIMYTV